MVIGHEITHTLMIKVLNMIKMVTWKTGGQKIMRSWEYSKLLICIARLQF
jgi:hypothetical protein